MLDVINLSIIELIYKCSVFCIKLIITCKKLNMAGIRSRETGVIKRDIKEHTR